MAQFFLRYATPFITGLFLISLISGIALFFHVGPSGFHGMHEWLSMVLILPFVLHLWRNWKPMISYFRRSPMIVALVISALAGAAFLVPLGTGATAGGPPQFQLAHMVMTRSVTEVAPLMGSTPEALTARLKAAGFATADVSKKLTEIASDAKKSEAELAAVLIKPAS